MEDYEAVRKIKLNRYFYRAGYQGDLINLAESIGTLLNGVTNTYNDNRDQNHHNATYNGTHRF